MGKYLLGEFEHLVLLAAIRLGEDAYGVSIARDLTARTGKDVSQAATYLTLKRLEEKGWLVSRQVRSDDTRGGRRKRTYVLTEEGMAQVRRSRATLMDMWADIQGELG